MTTYQREDIQTRIDGYWSGRAESYDEYQQREERRELDRAAWRSIWAAALPEPPARALDLGTGSGYVALLLAELGYDVTGLDGAEAMLDRAREHAGRLSRPPRFVLGDAVAPDFEDGTFDAVTSRYLMWTLREPAVALDRWRRLLRPGGVLAVVDAPWFPDGPRFGHGGDFESSYDEEVWAALPLAAAPSIDRTRDLVEAAGFEEVEVRPLTSILELDREHGVAPGHDLQLQYLVRGVCP